MITNVLAVTGVVPTKNRAMALARTLQSLAEQGSLPSEIIIIDSSDDTLTRDVAEQFASKWIGVCTVVWRAALRTGAAVQRNEGVAMATQPFVCFFDDDVLFEADCLIRLWKALKTDDKLGGVSAMIVNQRYQPPGTISRAIFALLHGRNEDSFAGRVIGPAINLLPEDDANLPEIVPVDWLNLGCTIYRRNALPDPPFETTFTGYSMLEDVALSLSVGRKWKLSNVRSARIFHDSQSSEQKKDTKAMAAMELLNRYYVMTEILGRRSVTDYAKLFLWEAFQITVCIAQANKLRDIKCMIQGKFLAVHRLILPRPAKVY